MFFSGSLQEGITLAVQQAKAVVCFVRDDSETSSTWEEEYFLGDEFTPLLETKSVLLRIAKDSPEAGFLSSVCPITQYPVVIAIRNGMLCEYIVPEISKEDFHSRLMLVLDGSKPQTQQAVHSTVSQNPPPSQEAGPSTTQATEPGVTAPSTTTGTAHSQSTPGQPSPTTPSRKSENKKVETTRTPRYSLPTAAQQPPKQKEGPKLANKDKKEKAKGEPSASKRPQPTEEASASQPRPARGPPSQYRLQVRLFDGRSVRSTFTPSQTIRKDVRAWLDGEMGEEKRPFNLKHILTPLPNQTLTIAEEDQALQELIVGSTATFVMVPVKSYIEAYTESSSTLSLPVRAVSVVYGLVSSAVSTAIGLGASLFAYGPAAASSQPEPAQPSTPQPTEDTVQRRRPFASGPNIRTLRDQQNDQDRSQFYNGNQLNFEPRQDDDGQ
ncbi:hypothetical protein ARAM_000146 [Aspergillus rambellii]|uniref:UBX domain-containing protein n=2 Tax=Aspergillus subgen. Nidulantes TaxID=2720870 RepID=A0A0F8XN03_9EURO|nr:hypothetical protein AOCH_001063 [Aspergillus ochraceoroseus]KKK24907.1 hypothetical protein ARAM_000146 [Aspergillus rambellii]